MLSHPVIEVDDISYVPDFLTEISKGDFVMDNLTGCTGVVEMVCYESIGINFLENGYHCFVAIPIWDVVKLKFTIGYNRSN